MQPMLPGRPATPGGDGAPVELLDMERRLREDADGRYHAQVLAEIETARLGLKRAADAGVPPEEYRQLATVLQACEAAAAVLEPHGGTAGPAPRPPFFR